MTNFKETLAKEKEAVLKKGFSMTSFLHLMNAYVNDPEFESHIMKVEEGKASKIPNKPVKNFRKVIYNILTDYGVSEKEAATIMTTYKFKSKDLEGLYFFMNDFIYQYVSTGRKYKLFNREDITADIYLKEVEEEVKEYPVRVIKDGKVVSETTKRYKKKKHNKLGQKSTCAKWNKDEIDENGEIVKSMEVVLKEISK